jgi:hypothetical protein
LNSSSTRTGLVEQCRREPPPLFFLIMTRKKETPLRLLFYACYVSLLCL